MTKTTLAKKLRFSDVVYAINSTPKALRLWLQRELVEIRTAKPKDGSWTEYSFFDIAILALVRSLVNCGVDVPSASAIANKIMGDHFYPAINSIEDLECFSPGVLATLWLNQRMYLYRDGDDAWQMKLVPLWESGLPSLPDFEIARPSAVAELRREHEPAPVYISIDVASILDAAFERAKESVTEGADDGGVA